MIEDDPKSLSLIRSNLSSLSMIHKGYAHYEYTVGNFELCIDTPVSLKLMSSNLHDISIDKNDRNDISIDKNDRITNYDTVQVQLYEWLPEETKHLFKFVHLEQDTQFAGYQYIKYTKPGYNRGKNMPIANLCELIRYLHRLSNLTAFL